MSQSTRPSLDSVRHVDAGCYSLWVNTKTCKRLTHAEQPSVRVELRPKKIGGHPHQLWCYHQGFLVNKHSGCGNRMTPTGKKCLVLIVLHAVLGVEKDKIKDQCVFQSKRLAQGEKKQTWEYVNSKLVLRHGDIEYALVSVCVCVCVLTQSCIDAYCCIE